MIAGNVYKNFEHGNGMSIDKDGTVTMLTEVVRFGPGTLSSFTMCRLAGFRCRSSLKRWRAVIRRIMMTLLIMTAI